MQDDVSQMQRIHDLEQEIVRLRHLLTQAGISYTPPFREEVITPQHALFFYSIFKGRKDVYSKRTPRKDGTAAYYPVCLNFWKENLCPRRIGAKTKCMDCQHRKWQPLRQRILMNHLIGIRDDGGDVIGIYPMMENETCHFLVFDFDSHMDPLSTDWKEDVNTLRSICNRLSVPILVERSRSGAGAHVWMFFSEAIPVKTVRQFGAALLTKGAESVNQKNFRSYDRMIPAQDYLPEGGLGNLIALPLQGSALKQGNSAFVDENWEPYPDQWAILRSVQKIPPSYIEKRIQEWGQCGMLGQLTSLSLSNDESEEKPWEARSAKLQKNDIKGIVHLTYAHMIFVEKSPLSPRAQNALRRLAAFSNPQFYRSQAMGFSTTRIPRIIYCGWDEENYIVLPRGIKEKLLSLLNSSDIPYTEDDIRTQGRYINIQFTGVLYPEQQSAATDMLKHETGILHAATAFGKTAVGAYLVAMRKVNTLVLVHNREIMKNWLEDFQKFLCIDEPLPTYQTSSGRSRVRKSHIGSLHSSHNSITGLIDIAMFSSLGSDGNIAEWVRNYGMVIMDECHHAAAQTAEDVLRNIPAKYVYGLTATPKRDDGMEPKMLMQFGPIRHKFTALQKAVAQNIQHLIYPRFTRLCNPGPEWKINEVYQAIINDETRNKLIIADTLAAVQQGRTPLLLTRYRAHAALLQHMLTPHVPNIILLQGGSGNREREQTRQQLHNVPADEKLVVVAIGKYIGEGFNLPRLDTLMLATPIAWEGNVEQYAGRLHRNYEGKKEVIIYDYVDSNIRVLDNMYHKRLRAYKKIGYSIYSPVAAPSSQADSIFDAENYLPKLEQDIQNAHREIIIACPHVNLFKTNWLCSILLNKHTEGIRTTIITNAIETYPTPRQVIIAHQHARLHAAGVHLNTATTLHHKFAIIDRSIVWYGDANILSKDKADTHLIRLAAPDLATELLAACADTIDSEGQAQLLL